LRFFGHIRGSAASEYHGVFAVSVRGSHLTVNDPQEGLMNIDVIKVEK